MDALLPFRVALLLFRVILFGCQTTQALNFSFSNSVRGTAGGDRLDQEIGQSRAFEIMDSSTNFIGNTFRQQSPMDRKDVHKVSLTVERVDKFPTFPSPSQIHLSAEYVAKYGGDLKKEIRGVSYHEMVHVWQWNVQENAPGGLIQGITDNVRLTAELAPSHWVKPGARDKWHHAYDVTAYILKYYESVSSGFVVNMNAKLKGGWNPGFFNDLTGKFVD